MTVDKVAEELKFVKRRSEVKVNASLHKQATRELTMVSSGRKLYQLWCTQFLAAGIHVAFTLQAVLSVTGGRPQNTETDLRGKAASLEPSSRGPPTAANLHDSFLADAARLMNRPRRLYSLLLGLCQQDSLMNDSQA